MNEYFIPKEEDLSVGYELELHIPTSPTPIKTRKVEVEEIQYIAYLIRASNELVRVPYITPKDIVDEGWILHSVNKDQGLTTFIHPRRKSLYASLISGGIVVGDKRVPVRTLSVFYKKEDLASSPTWLYCGDCDSINEFRQIMKLLKVKE